MFLLLFFFAVALALPLFFLWTASEPLEVVASVLQDSLLNTGGLALWVVSGALLLGSCLAFLQTFVDHPGRRLFHALTFLPLAIPPYVLAFIYMGAWMGHGLDLWQPLQGELGVLAVLLILSLSPYVYLFAVLSLQGLRQSEWESECLLDGGSYRFFRSAIWPRSKWPLLGAGVLVLFETLADFGAASVINVRVMTTLIYRTWFDLFSFASAARLSFYFALLVTGLLLCEAWLRIRQGHVRDESSEPFQPPLSGGWSVLALILRSLYLIFALIFPLLQLLYWAQTVPLRWPEVFFPLAVTFAVSLAVATLVVLLSLVLGAQARRSPGLGELAVTLSTFAYGMPGTVLAVSLYGGLVFLFDELSAPILFLGLVVALSLKFLSLGLRPISQSLFSFPVALEEMSALLAVGFYRRVRYQFLPILQPTLLAAFLLLVVEVIKEMPLTLMLAPSDFPTLAIRVYTLTAEAKWAEASLPALMIIFSAGVAVLFLQRQSRNL